MFQTAELGPRLNTPAPNFTLFNHDHRERSVADLSGARGLLLGFTGDIWQPASVRRILWLQRHSVKFTRMDINIALLICDKPHMLYGFYMSTARPLEFPLLADVDRQVHRQFNMERYSGLVLLDHSLTIVDKWIVPDERVWPKVQELIESCRVI
jgi:peroxiredoxin